MTNTSKIIPNLSCTDRSKLFNELRGLFHEAGQNMTFDKDEDIRTAVFFACRDCTLVVLIPLTQISRVEENVITKDQYPIIFGIDDTFSKYVFDRYLQFQRYSYLTFCMFHIENALRAVLKEILGKNPDDGYYNICSTLLKKISIDSPNEKLNILLIPSFIRNSFHSNGIHTKKINGKESTKYIIQGYEFTFEKNKIVNCAGWFHIYILMKEMILVLKQIMQSPEVQNITKLIPSQYATN